MRQSRWRSLANRLLVVEDNEGTFGNGWTQETMNVNLWQGPAAGYLGTGQRNSKLHQLLTVQVSPSCTNCLHCVQGWSSVIPRTATATDQSWYDNHPTLSLPWLTLRKLTNPKLFKTIKRKKCIYMFKNSKCLVFSNENKCDQCHHKLCHSASQRGGTQVDTLQSNWLFMGANHVTLYGS